MILPDNSFFELLRSVLGNIKTPFSKQKLLDDLFSLLSRDEIRNIIAAYIGEQDHKIIAAVTLLNEPVLEDLVTFFAGEFSPGELHSLVINLEERLILYRFRDKESLRLTLNPVLEQVLAPFTEDTSSLFPSYDDGKKTHDNEKTFLTDGRIMAALFAFIQNEEELFKPAIAGSEGIMPGGIRKKVLDEGKKLFPYLDFEMTVMILLMLGLLRLEGRSMVSCNDKVMDFCDLSPLERQEYWAAAIYLCPVPGEENFTEKIPGISFHLRRAASFIHRINGLMEPDRRYSIVTIRRVAEFLEREEKRITWGSSLFDVRMDLGNILTAMIKTGLLEKTASIDKNEFRKTSGADPNPQANDASRSTAGQPVIVMDTALSFIIYPEILFEDAMALSNFCSIKENNKTTVSFELTRQSVVRGFDQGTTVEEIIALLNRLSLNRLDANLDFTLREWESRYKGVSMHQGIILTLSDDRRYLAEAGPVSRLIRKTLAPGVYLLSSAERSEAAKALLKAGVDIIGQPPSNPTLNRPIFSRNSFSRLSAESHSPIAIHTSNKETGKKAAQEDADSIKQNFRQTLEKMRLTKQEREELLARIERRIILSEAQLEATSLRYEKLEARGLDYAGKSMLARGAIETRSLVEVSWPGPGGELNHTMGIPQSLEKKEGDSILVLRASGNSESILRIPLGKISLFRRIKQSIFGE
jgi:hypothetical protein